MSRKILAVMVMVVALAPLMLAQTRIDLPDDSQAASVSQRIGLTDITINYHRPQVKNRKIVGGLLPYGQVWRAGANMNTTIVFTDDVTVEGKPLAKGIYGVHMIPGENEWTVIFSNASNSWGSYTYDAKEDALRVSVKPHADEMNELLTYSFSDVTANSTVVNLQWEKTAVPFKIAIDLNKTVEARLASQLRTGLHWQWDAYDDAAKFILGHKGNLNDALAYTKRSVELEPRFSNMFTEGQVLDAMGKTQEAEAIRAKAMPLATNVELYGLARWQQRHGQGDKAIATFRTVSKMQPDHWIAHLALARAYSAEKNFAEANKEMDACMAGAPEDAKSDLAPLQAKLRQNVDIN